MLQGMWSLPRPGSSPCPLHWQVDSQPLDHEGSPNTITVTIITKVCVLSQSCLTLCDLTDCSPPGSSVHGDTPGKNTGMGCRALLQGIFPIQESKWGLLHCRQIVYQLSYQGNSIKVYLTQLTDFT